MVGDVVDGDLQGVVVAEDDHGDGVADEDQVDAGFVGHARPGGVVGRDHHERIAAGADLAGADGGRGELCAHCCTSYRPAPGWLPAAPEAYAVAPTDSNPRHSTEPSRQARATSVRSVAVGGRKRPAPAPTGTSPR